MSSSCSGVLKADQLDGLNQNRDATGMVSAHDQRTFCFRTHGLLHSLFLNSIKNSTEKRYITALYVCYITVDSRYLEFQRTQ